MFFFCCCCLDSNIKNAFISLKVRGGLAAFLNVFLRSYSGYIHSTDLAVKLSFICSESTLAVKMGWRTNIYRYVCIFIYLFMWKNVSLLKYFCINAFEMRKVRLWFFFFLRIWGCDCVQSRRTMGSLNGKLHPLLTCFTGSLVGKQCRFAISYSLTLVAFKRPHKKAAAVFSV